MHRKALEISEKLGKLEGMASDYVNLGVLLHIRGDLKGARALWIRSRDIYTQMGVTHMAEMVGKWIDGLGEE